MAIETAYVIESIIRKMRINQDHSSRHEKMSSATKCKLVVLYFMPDIISNADCSKRSLSNLDNFLLAIRITKINNKLHTSMYTINEAEMVITIVGAIGGVAQTDDLLNSTESSILFSR